MSDPEQMNCDTDPSCVIHGASGHMAMCLLGQEICFQHRGNTLSSFTSCSHFFVCILRAALSKWFALSVCRLVKRVLVKATKQPK